jgi:hypothetical protein
MPSSGMWRRVDIVSAVCPAHAGSSLAIFLLGRWRRYVPPKRRFTQDLYGVTSHKTAFFIVTAMETSDLTKLIQLLL